jgi:hypothetical protein
MTNDPRQLKRNFSNRKWRLKCGVGIPTGAVNGFIVIETDTKKGHGVDGKASLRKLEAKYGKLPETLMAVSPTGSEHRYYNHPGPGIKVISNTIASGVDVKGDGGMVIAPPSVRPGIGPYIWSNWGTPIADAPQWLIDLVTSDRGPNKNPKLRIKNTEPVEIKHIVRALAVTSSDSEPVWYENGCAIAKELGDDGHDLYIEWSKKSDKFEQRDCEAKWEHDKENNGYNAATIFHHAGEDWRDKEPPNDDFTAWADKTHPGWRGEEEKEEEQDTRPIIRIRAGELPKIATRGEEVLLASGLPIYQRGDDLMRPIVEDVPAAHDRTTKVARLIRIDAVYLSDVLGRVAQWQRKVWGHWVPTDVPVKVATRILGRKGEWKFPKVSGVISTPTMRYDGTILDQEGYDPATKLLLLAPPSMPAIPEMPTRDDALASLALLQDLLVEFPLVEEVDKAVALSGFITPVVRGAFIVAPMHTSRAPVAGSGKSYLWDCSSTIATGQIMPVISKGANEEELEKRLGTEMMTGQPLISIDNVNGELKSDALCQITERPAVHIRILGKSERVRVEPRGTTVFCTGNNIIIVGDLYRRVITAMLDPQLERPELREFNGNPVAKILAKRGSYIAACLTICRAYIVAGRPNKAKRLASYEGWSDTVRSALMWLGKADPVISIEAARADDPELNELRELLEAWAEVFWRGESVPLHAPGNNRRSQQREKQWARSKMAAFEFCRPICCCLAKRARRCKEVGLVPEEQKGPHR